MAIFHRHYPDAKLFQIQIDIIQVKPFTAVDANSFRGDFSTILTFQICTGSILNHLCKRIHKGLVNANYQWTWGALKMCGADCGRLHGSH